MKLTIGAAAQQDPTAPPTRTHRVVCGQQWAVVTTCAGVIAGATWSEVLLYGPVPGFAFGCLLGRTPVRTFVDVVTLRGYHIWKHRHE